MRCLMCSLAAAANFVLNICEAVDDDPASQDVYYDLDIIFVAVR